MTDTIHHNEADSNAVFEAAIAIGALSRRKGDVMFAGDWMYMHHSDEHTACFKHRDTREYLKVRLPSLATYRSSSVPGGRP